MTPTQTRLKGWREDPVKFVQEVLGAEPDDWQVDILRAFPTHNRLAMKACKGPGKSTVDSWMAWNFLLTRPHPKVAATSITGDNLADGLWTEMSKWQQKSELLQRLFLWEKKRISSREFPETWWMSARTWSKTADAQTQGETLAGLHADFLLFILDESGGIPDAVMAAAEAGLATGTETKIVQSGNPTMLEGPLWRACTMERELWYVVEITGDPDDPKRAKRISKKWAQEQIQKYGADNPWVLVNVFGKFPPGSSNTLLGYSEVQDAMAKHIREEEYNFSERRLGIDVARFGSDRTVMFPRQGLAAFPPHVMRHANGPEVAARVAMSHSTWPHEADFVDDSGGYGGSVIDAMNMGPHSATPVNFSGRPDDPKFLNRRAEMWFRMAEWVKRGGALPSTEPDILKELTSPTYDYKNGRFQLEAKSKIKERLGFSPDVADALALTFAHAESPRSATLIHGRPMPERERVVSEYDVMDEESTGVYDPTSW